MYRYRIAIAVILFQAHSFTIELNRIEFKMKWDYMQFSNFVFNLLNDKQNSSWTKYEVARKEAILFDIIIIIIIMVQWWLLLLFRVVDFILNSFIYSKNKNEKEKYQNTASVGHLVEQLMIVIKSTERKQINV